MRSIVKLLGVSCCCLAIGALSAGAGPVQLADAELDRIAAGACSPGSGPCTDVVVQRPNLIDTPRSPFGGFRLQLPSTPGDPQPIEPRDFLPTLPRLDPGGIPMRF